jgi:hypothetical protein
VSEPATVDGRVLSGSVVCLRTIPRSRGTLSFLCLITFDQCSDARSLILTIENALNGRRRSVLISPTTRQFLRSWTLWSGIFNSLELLWCLRH